MTKCPQCGKAHRKGRAFNKCEVDSQFFLSHYIIMGLKESDPRMMKARAEAATFQAYAKEIKG